VTVNGTETPVLDQTTLELDTQSEQITAETQAETLQTASSTLGTVVGGRTMTSLPLASRNYTQILDLSAGANVGATDATQFGKGTQTMSVNGNDPGQNNFQMDGVNIANWANAGNSDDSVLYTRDWHSQPGTQSRNLRSRLPLTTPVMAEIPGPMSMS
jgi:hypothetical protein